MTTPVITAWAAVSPYGMTEEDFRAGLRAGPAATTALEAGSGPHADGYLVPDFDVRSVLGRKGTRSMDRVSALAVATVRQLLAASGTSAAGFVADDAAVVLGTTTGSAKSMMDITRDTLIHEKPFYIDASRIPNAIMNSAAAQCAIWHGLRGPNVTVAGGKVAGLIALRYATRLIRANRATMVICGGAEEHSIERAWLEFHGAPDDEICSPLGEGCAVMLVQSVEAAAEAAQDAQDAPEVHCDVLAIELTVHAVTDIRESVTRCLRRALDSAAIGAAEVWAVSAAPASGRAGAQERLAVTDVLVGESTRALWMDGFWGDAGAVSAGFLIGVLQAEFALAFTGDDSPEPRIGVVVAVDRDGLAGAAVLRIRRRR